MAYKAINGQIRSIKGGIRSIKGEIRSIKGVYIRGSDTNRAKIYAKEFQSDLMI